MDDVYCWILYGGMRGNKLSVESELGQANKIWIVPKNQCFISHTKVSGSTVVFKVFKLVNEFMEIVCKVWFFCDTKANANFSVGAWYYNQHFLKYSNI